MGVGMCPPCLVPIVQKGLVYTVTQSIAYTLGSSCDDEKKTLHAVYMTVILLLLISNLVLIYLLWRMRSRSGELLLTKLSKLINFSIDRISL